MTKMARMTGTMRFLIGAALLAGMAMPGTALAIDPPQWVAALHIAGQEAVGLRWSPVAGATGYKVLRSTTAGSGHQELAATATPQYFDKDLTPGTTYYYVLQSVAGAETSAPSAERSVAIPGVKKQEAIATPALNPPVLSQITEFGKTISKIGLTWPKVTGAIAYNIMRSTTKGQDYKMLTSISETSYVDADVQIGTTYYYTISALDQSFQESPQSAEHAVEVKEPEVKQAAVKKEKIKIMLRKTRRIREIKEGDWGNLQQPAGVALAANGDIYVVDAAKKRVYVFNQAGEFLFTFGETELTNSPQDLAISDDDDVLVAQGSNLFLYSSDGKLRKTVELKGLMNDVPEDERQASRVEAGSKGRWYITNSGAMKIYIVDEDFEVLETIGSAGQELGQFRQPVGVFEDRKGGHLLVADTFNFMAKVFKDGKPLAGWGSYGNSVGQFGRILDVTMVDKGVKLITGEDSGPHLLAADYLNANIQGFDLTGKFLYVLGVEEMNNQISLSSPTSIVERAGRLYVCEKLGSRISVYELLDEVGPPKKK